MANMRHVCTNQDSNALCDLADEVDRVFGSGITMVSLGGVCPSSIYIDTRFPTCDRAFDYARELYLAALEGRQAYKDAIRS